MKRHKIIFTLLFLLLVSTILFLMSYYDSKEEIIVIDGDTLKVCEKNYCKLIRIYGIDAPELNKSQKKYVLERLEKIIKRKVNISCLDLYGFLSKKFLEEILNKKQCKIVFKKIERDKYKRELSFVFLKCENKSIDVGKELVLKGYALAYFFDKNKTYFKEMYEAFRERRGLWRCIERD